MAEERDRSNTTAPNLAARWASWSPRLRSVLRIVASFTFMQVGMMKLIAFPAGMPPRGETVKLMSELGLAGVLETFGGALLLLGLFTRPVAFLLAGEMAVAYFQVHFPRNFWPVLSGGTDAMLYCFLWLYFSAAGPGPLSLDALRLKPSRRGSAESQHGDPARPAMTRS